MLLFTWKKINLTISEWINFLKDNYNFEPALLILYFMDMQIQKQNLN